ncbi:hypothetical protein RchiOBHm_Chr2g0174231 [Rosa chinensis]|uniref:Uncharacterized protein n=1 Tax=Rosa chinensis TaxID=74649 RepID=A0A2P6S631_ROSCH|nr:hypothetical protein RchiOBHm_Chr2g0174231 [Rosa chinensis]
MATAALLIEANPLMKLKQNTLLRTFRPLPSKPIALTFSNQRCFAPRIFKNPKPRCFLPADSKCHPSHSQSLNVLKDNRPAAANPNFTVAVNKVWEKCHRALREPAMAAVLFGLLVMCNPNSAALAAPVGRVGGSLTLTRTTLHHPSKYSSTTITTSDHYDDPIWEIAFYFFFDLYCLWGLFALLSPYPKFYTAALFIFGTVFTAIWVHSLGQTSVVKLQLQVTLSNTGRAVQTDLNRIAETADTSTRTGLRYVLRGELNEKGLIFGDNNIFLLGHLISFSPNLLVIDTAVALFRQPDYCISGYSCVGVSKFTRAAAQQCFDKIVFRERVRYDEETIVNVDNIKTQSTTSQRSTNESHNDNVEVTILLAVDGKSKLPTIIDSSDLKKVMEELASIDPNRLLLVRIKISTSSY